MSSSATTSKKRKSDNTGGTASKKARAGADMVEAILTNSTTYTIPSNENGFRDSMRDLALYARSLEEEVASMKPKPKSAAQISAEADKLANAARSGIRKQMTWKTSCKTGSAKWTYDGVCTDPAVFGALLGLNGPPGFKTKKFPKGEFEDLIGDLQVSVRYDYLNLSGDVNVRWNPNENTFKFSGTYGK